MTTTNNYNYSSTYGGSFENGWKVMSKYFLYLFLAAIIMSIVDGPKNMLQFKMNAGDLPSNWNFHDLDKILPFSSADLALGTIAIALGILALAYSILLVPIFKYGSDMMYVQAARDTKPDINYLVKGFKENYFQIVLASLLTTALIMMGFFALIVPGIIIACRLVFVSYLVMDKKLDPIAAVEESWRMTRGHGWTIFFMGLTSFFICIAGLLICFVGIIPAIIWIGGSFASLYESILREKTPIENDIVPAI